MNIIDLRGVKECELLYMLLNLILFVKLEIILRMQLEPTKVYDNQSYIPCIASKGKYYFGMA